MLGGFAFLLGLGLFTGGCIGSAAKQAPQMSHEREQLFDYYHSVAVNDGIYDFPQKGMYAPYIWPEYIFIFNSPNLWSMQASQMGLSEGAAKLRYLSWRCHHDGMPFDWELAKMAYMLPASCTGPMFQVVPKLYLTVEEHIKNKEKAKKTWAKKIEGFEEIEHYRFETVQR